MKKCVACGREISDTAKFCGYCRAKQEVPELEQSPVKSIECHACQSENSLGAKFCRHCGARLEVKRELDTPVRTLVNAADERERHIEMQRGFITWKVLPGQLAVKIDEKEIDSYGMVRGLLVAPGTKALFFVNGKYAATLESGRYSFQEMNREAKEETEKQEKKGVLSFLRNLVGHIADGAAALFRTPGRPFYSVVLCRGDEFPLVYEFENVRTATVSCNVGLHFLCKISDINGFAESILTDKKYVSLEMIANLLNPYIQTIVNQSLIYTVPERINEDASAMQELLARVAERVQMVYPFLSVAKIISATANNEALDHIRSLKEELYIKEQELEQVQLRNDFLNRLQDVERSNALRNARSEVDYQALMDDIELDGMRNQDRRESIVLMLVAEQKLRMARTQVDLEVAFNQLEQSRMMSKEEIEVLRRQIDHRAAIVKIGNDQEIAMANLENGQLLAMATLRNEVALDSEKLKWEVEIGNKRFENELWRDRERNKLKNEERDADFAFAQRQMGAQMELLRQAQAMRNEREEAEHRRRMDEIRVNNEIEQAKLDHEAEKIKLMGTMTFEQIMALNPDISPDAARALAEKFKAQAAATNMDKYDELVQRHEADLKEFLNQNMGLVRELIRSQNNLQAARLNDKEMEVERLQKDANRNADRLLDSVKTTVDAVSGQPRIITPPVVSAYPAAPVVATSVITKAAEPAPAKQEEATSAVGCPKCGKMNGTESAFCEECGEKLNQDKG